MRTIETPLGKVEISFDAICNKSDEEAAKNCIQVIPYSPRVPPGMSVTGCFVAVALITPRYPLRNVLFRARLNAYESIDSGPETGEALDALSFYGNHHIVLVGTEETDFLNARLKGAAEFPEAQYPFTEDAVTIQLLEASAEKTLSLHFVVAWNKLPEPKDCSCWFAVDQDHKAILSVLGANRKNGDSVGD